jgi:hypothetical protein
MNQEQSKEKCKRNRDNWKAEALRLRDALKRYGLHETDCTSMRTGISTDCDCGLKTALAGKDGGR